MKKMYYWITACAVFLFSIVAEAQTVMATYTAGDIPTRYNPSAGPFIVDNSCNGSSTVLTLPLPAGGPWKVTGIDVGYSMTSSDVSPADGYASEQRSRIYFQNTSTPEVNPIETSGLYHGVGLANVTYPYNRNGVDIANGIYPGGTNLIFEMHAWRTYDDNPNPPCNNLSNKVDNGTWTITVHYIIPPTCIDPSNIAVSGTTHSQATIGWAELGTATTWNIEYGPVGFTQGSAAGTIVSTTNNPYNLTGLAGVTSYDVYVQADCGGGDTSNWTGPETFQTTADCTIYSLAITSTTDGGVCEEGSATLTAAAGGGGSDVFWYDAASGGKLMGFGNSFETPFLDVTTSYWAAEVVHGGSLIGQAFANPPSTFSNSTSNAGGLLFTITSPIIIVDVEVFSTNATSGDITIELRDIGNGNATIASTTASITGGGTASLPISQIVTLNFAVPSAGNYRLVRSASTASVGMGNVLSAGTNFPYPLGSSGEVTGGSTLASTSTTHFFFYNWTIIEAALCESTRDEAIATVHEIIDVTASATQTSISPGGSTTLSASSTNTNYTYVWNPGNLSGASVSVSPSQHTTYTVTATDTVTGCESTDEITILVFNTSLCNDLDITSVSDSYICDEGTATLSVVAAGISGDEIYWYDAVVGGNRVGTGATFETPFLTQTTSYWATEVIEEGDLFTGVGIVTPSGTGTNSTVNYGMEFTVTEATTIVSVDVLSTANGGDLSIALYDANNLVVGNHIAYHTETIIAGNYHTIVLNFDVPAAGTYRLVRAAQSVTIALRSQNTTGVTNPYPIGTIGQINGGHLSLTGTVGNSQYMFYNWTFSTAFSLCESPREEVIATVVETVDIDVSATQTSINPGGNTTLTATSTNTNYTYIWNPGNLSGASVNVSPSQHTTYTVTATDSVTGCVATDEIEILVFNTALCNALNIVAGTGGYVCEEGTTNLSATASGSGNEIYWYDAVVDGNRVGIGTTIETPYITQTTSFWAAEVLLGTKVLTGQAFANPTTFTNSTSNAGGLLFYVDSPITIIDVEVFSTNANSGDITIELRDVDNGNAIIATTTASITGGGTAAAPIPQTIAINFTVPVGNYRLVRSAATATVGLGNVSAANSNFPYPLGSSGEVTGGSTLTATSTTHFFFYNWTIEEALFLCESSREEVIATVVEIDEVDVTATQTSVNPGGSTTLTASSTNTNYVYTWEPAASIAGSNVGASVTTTALTDHTTFTVTATDSVTGCATEEEIQILVFDLTLCNPLNITATTSDTICIGETANLSATASGTGDVIYWYDAEFGGNKVGEGANFETPALTSTTSYWAAEVLIEGIQVNLGPLDPSIGTSSTSNLTGHGMFFTVLTPTVLVSVDVFPTVAVGTNSSILIRNGSSATGTIVATVPYVTTVSGTLANPIAQTVIMDIALPPGSYTMTPGIGINIIRNTTGASYPYISTVVEITGNTFDPVYWYWFYNWQFGEEFLLCESDREEAVATVDDIIPVEASATQTSIDPGNNTTLTATSTNANYTYVWTWDGGTDTGSPIIVSPTVHTTYTVTATDTVSGCVATDEITILVFNTALCNTLDITATTGDIICIGDTATLTATPSGTGNLVRWYDAEFNGNLLGVGASYETPVLTSTTSYWAAEVLYENYYIAPIEASYAAGGLTYFDATNGAGITFAVQNTNTHAVKMKKLDFYMPANSDFTFELWYHPTSITGAPGIISSANGWIQIAGSEFVTSGSTNGIYNAFSNLSFEIPATTTYRFILIGTGVGSQFTYFNASGAPNMFSSGGVNLLVGDNQAGGTGNVGYSGTNPLGTAIGTNPRFFYGGIDFNQELCESDREEAIATVTSDDAPIGDATQEFKAGSGDMLNDLDVTGSNLIWYSDAAGTTVIPGTTMLVGGTTYYVSQTINGCESQMLAITVVEVVCNAPTALNVSGITQTTAQVSWTASTSATGGYSWAVFNTGANPSTATPVVDGNVATGINTVMVSGLTANTTYDFYIASYCGTSIMSDMAGPLTFTTAPLPCAAPTALSMGTVTQNTAQFSWSASPNEIGGYSWYVFASGANPNTATPVTSGNVGTGITTVNVTSLTASTAYDFYVATLCTGSVESDKAGPLAFTTAAMPCAAPTALSMGTVTQTTAQFSWTASPNEAGGYTWYVYMSGANPNTATPVTSGNVGTGITTVNVSSLTASTAYDFYVATLCTGGAESSKAGPVMFTTAAMPCDAPTALAVGNVTQNSAQFTWTASATETGGYAWYKFAAGANPNTATPLANGNVATGVTTVNVSGMSPSTAYDFYVSTICTGGVESSKAGPLSFTTGALVCDEPTALMAGTITETTAEISWTASTSETNGYDWAVFNAGANPLTDTPVDDGSVASGVTSVTITGLTQNTSYDVYVRTNCGTDGLSDWAGPLNFSTQPLGIRDNIIEGFTFYPNPMADVINISAKNTIDAVVIFNLIGQKLIDQKIGATTAQFDVSNFASGPYLMQVTSNGQIGIFRIIKK